MSDQPAPSVAIIAATARNNLIPTLPGCNYLSPPLISVASELGVAFLIGHAEWNASHGGYRIWPPSLLAVYSANNGRFLSLTAVTPGDFGLDHASERPLGGGVSPTDREQVSVLAKEITLFEACDNVLDKLRSNEPFQDAMQTYRTAITNFWGTSLTEYINRSLDQISTRIASKY